MNPAKTPTQLRLTQDLLERADALIEVMAADPEVRALGMPTRTAVLRLAIARGLRDLERQYQRPTPAYASAPHLTTTPHDATPPRARGRSPTCMRGVTARTRNQARRGTGPACRRPHRKDCEAQGPIAPQSCD
jgi:hypothetical protein